MKPIDRSRPISGPCINGHAADWRIIHHEPGFAPRKVCRVCQRVSASAYYFRRKAIREARQEENA